MARFVVLSFENHDKAMEFVKDLNLGRIMAWERGVREGVRVEAVPLAVVKPSTISNRPLRTEDFWQGAPEVITDGED